MAGFIPGIPKPNSQTGRGKEKDAGEELGNVPWSQEKTQTCQKEEREMACFFRGASQGCLCLSPPGLGRAAEEAARGEEISRNLLGR